MSGLPCYTVNGSRGAGAGVMPVGDGSNAGTAGTLRDLTLAMIDGLCGAADYNGDGEVYLPELDLYVTEQVRLRSGKKQTPALSRPLSAPFAL